MMHGQPPMQAPPAPQPAQPQQPQVTIDAVVALLRDDRMRGFRIEVETDSMVEADQNAEKQNRIEFVTAVGEFLTKLGPVVQAMPPLAPLVGGMLQFAVRGFKVGQELEELIDKTMASVSDTLSQPRPPQPDPTEIIKAQTAQQKGQVEIAKANIDAQVAQQEGAAKIQSQKIELVGKLMDHHHAQAEHELDASQMVMEGQQAERQAALDAQSTMMQNEQAQAEHQMKLQQIEAAKKAAKAKPKGDK